MRNRTGWLWLGVTLALVPGARAQQADPESGPPVDVDAPALALTGVGYDIGLSLEEGAGEQSFVLRSSAGRELSRGTLSGGESLEIEGLSLASSDLPLRLESGDVAQELAPLLLPGWTSLLPPILAIALALIFKEVVVSLFVGVWIGALLVTGINPIAATLRTVDRFLVPALADPDHAAIIMFSALLLGMVGVMSRSGGTQGIVNAILPIATTQRRAQLATYLGGLAIFFDDYSNTLIVGNTMRPITDRMRVSREKLAYIVDSTAAPVAAIVFVSTWVGYEIGLIGDGLAAAGQMPGVSPALAAELASANPFTIFLHSIPYLFYPILALVMVGLVVFTQRDFGPMLAAERRASRGEGLYREGAALLVDTEEEHMAAIEGAPLRWFNAAIPVLTVVVVTVAGLYLDGQAKLGRPGSLSEIFGEADPYAALLWGSMSGLLVAIALSAIQRILKLREAVEAGIGGIKATLLAFIILVLAWSLGEVTEVLGTAEYLAGLLTGNLLPALLPFIVFVMAAAIAFSTGTSWATMAILIPLVVPLAVALGGFGSLDGGESYTIVLGSISSVLAGSIWGDHCSPISDTTVLSSMASACDHVDHVRTQLPYALLVGAVAVAVGDIPTAFGMSPVISYAIGIPVLYGILRVFGRRVEHTWTAAEASEAA